MIGPLANEKQRDTVESYIAKGTAEGGCITTGGGRPQGFDSGWFVEPTIVADVDNDATIAREEIFGPVLVIPTTTMPTRSGSPTIPTTGSPAPSGPATSTEVRTWPGASRPAASASTGSPSTRARRSVVSSPADSGELGPEGLAAYQQHESIYLPTVRTLTTTASKRYACE